MNLIRLFCDHPRSVGETYLQHCRSACGFSFQLLIAAVAAFVHAFFPFAFIKTASRIVTDLHRRMVSHRIQPAASEVHQD